MDWHNGLSVLGSQSEWHCWLPCFSELHTHWIPSLVLQFTDSILWDFSMVLCTSLSNRSLLLCILLLLFSWKTWGSHSKRSGWWQSKPLPTASPLHHPSLLFWDRTPRWFSTTMTPLFLIVWTLCTAGNTWPALVYWTVTLGLKVRQQDFLMRHFLELLVNRHDLCRGCWASRVNAWSCWWLSVSLCEWPGKNEAKAKEIAAKRDNDPVMFFKTESTLFLRLEPRTIPFSLSQLEQYIQNS